MKITLINRLIVNGATQRLDELNKEREQLIKLIDRYSDTKVPKFLHPEVKNKRYKGKHWTQKPENRAKMMKNIRKAIKRANTK